MSNSLPFLAERILVICSKLTIPFHGPVRRPENLSDDID